MGFKFAWFCELLEELNQNTYQQRATYSKYDDPNQRIVNTWFQKHADHIVRNGSSAIAFLSCVFPERRPDRTYNLQQRRLSQILGRILLLGTNRLQTLESWRTEGGQDFPSCLETTMRECEFAEPPSDQQVTLEEIDIALTRIAANNIASAPMIRVQRNTQTPTEILTPLIRRLRSHEAKWLMRMILKSYNPVEIPEDSTLYSFHFLLPKLLAMQNSFEAVVDIISTPEIGRLNPRPSKEYEAALLPILARDIKPRLGVMIRRQPFDKARSIKHCAKIANSRTMSIERKYDGEYCQVHIDNSEGRGAIQIFSKSGKDSTQDRIGLHSAIRSGLKLKTSECKIKNRAILEGELLIYSRNDNDILPFHHIRRHVLHGGRRIGTEMDSPKKVGEQLMIVFFDVLLLDDKVMLNEPHRVRRAHLKGLVTRARGEAQVVERHIIDFKSSRAKHFLIESFSHAIRMRWEGFVLKGLDDPYYTWKQDIRGIRSIKLKKDYIAGLGDSADLCIVGGCRDPNIETELSIGRLSWTTFHIACLTNKLQVQRYNARPIFKIVDCLGPGSMSRDDVQTLNAEGRLVEKGYAPDSEHMLIRNPRRDIPLPVSIYTKPMVVEIFGAGYERPQTADFYILRFPRCVGSRIKIHKDRDIADTVDFSELQAMAEVSLKEADDRASQEEIEWMERLLAADPKSKYIVDKSQSTSPSKTQHSATTASLTPVGHKWSTQPPPMLVRADSDEMTPTELSERYPDSAPEASSRRSDSTVSPTTATRSREVSRRDFATETSPTPPSRKRRRVAFEPTNRISNSRPTSDMSWVNRRDEYTSKEKHVEQFMMPPPKKKRRSSPTIEEVSVGSTRTESGSTIQSSPDASPPHDETRAVAPPPDQLTSSTTTLPVATQSRLQLSSNPQSKTTRLSASFLLQSLKIVQPIYLTSSVLTHSGIPSQYNNLTEIIRSQNLISTPVPKTFIRHLFPPQSATTTTTTAPCSSRTEQQHPSTPDSTNKYAHHMMLLDPMNPTAAIKDVKYLIDNINLPRPGWKPTLPNQSVGRDIVVMDHRVVKTEWWRDVIQRTFREIEDVPDKNRVTGKMGEGAGGTKDDGKVLEKRRHITGLGEDKQGEQGNDYVDIDAHNQEEEEWKRYFIGRLNVGFALVEQDTLDGPDGSLKVEHVAFGEMIWG